MAVAGICHSDDHFATGGSVPDDNLRAMVEAAGMPMPEWFPLLGGHEGAGIVEEVGPGVESLPRVLDGWDRACVAPLLAL
jgi:Zn-dependent alcohol dehydrogenase